MKKTTTNTTTITSTTKKIKVQFQTSTKEFTSILAAYWIAENELSDKVLTYRQNIKVCDKMLSELADGTAHPLDDTDWTAKRAEYYETHLAYKTEYKLRVEEAYSLLTPDLYEAYTTDKTTFTKAVTTWFISLK